MQENLCRGVIFYKIAGTKSRSVVRLKSSLNQGSFPVSASEFPWLLRKVSSELLRLLVKLRLHTTGRNFIKTLVHNRLFSQSSFFKTVRFGNIIRKKIAVKPVYSIVAVRTL